MIEVSFRLPGRLRWPWGAQVGEDPFVKRGRIAGGISCPMPSTISSAAPGIRRPRS